jgi:hypothetical protein
VDDAVDHGGKSEILAVPGDLAEVLASPADDEVLASDLEDLGELAIIWS